MNISGRHKLLIFIRRRCLIFGGDLMNVRLPKSNRLPFVIRFSLCHLDQKDSGNSSALWTDVNINVHGLYTQSPRRSANDFKQRKKHGLPQSKNARSASGHTPALPRSHRPDDQASAKRLVYQRLIQCTSSRKGGANRDG